MGAMSRRKGGGMLWKALPGFPAYEISEFGDVRRVVDSPTRKIGHIVKGQVRRQGGYRYRLIKLVRADGTKQCRSAHRLVALAFIGAPPTPRHEVAHNDGNALNNDYRNLRWATAAENGRDKTRHGVARGSRNPRARLTETKVAAIRRTFTGRRGEIAALARVHGVSHSAMFDAIRGNHWRHVDSAIAVGPETKAA